MLYSLILELIDTYSFLNVFKYLTVRTGLAVFTSLLIVFLIGTPFINFFSYKKILNPIREDGPDEHIIKKIGTPTMWGVLILIGLSSGIFLWGDLKNIYIWFLIYIVASYGLLGAYYDYKKIKSAWQLNERHYGSLTGLNKDEMKKKLGEEKVHQFRRSWDLRPNPLDKSNSYHPLNINTYKDIPIDKIPDTESLRDTYERVIKYYNEDIENNLKNKNILISAHGNSIRALCKYLFNLDNNQISKLEIPTGNPLLIQFDTDNKILNCKYLDSERAKDLLVY